MAAMLLFAELSTEAAGAGSFACFFSGSDLEGVSSSNRDEEEGAAVVEDEGSVCWGVEGVDFGGFAPGIIIAGLKAC